jgi:protein-tyrosine-phosphatase
MQNILFVCTDNIGRSVIAGYCLKDYFIKNNIKNVSVLSAGTNASSNISGFSMAHFPEMKKLGIDASKHWRRQLTKELFFNADRVIIFDFKNKEWIEQNLGTEVMLFNQLYKGEEMELRTSGDLFTGSHDDRMIQATHYIYDAMPIIWEKIKFELLPKSA